MKIQATIGALALVIGASVIGFRLQAAESASEASTASAAHPAITVYKSPSCGCCAGWVEHLENAGFDVRVEDTNAINDVKVEHQVPRDLSSCHTAIIDGAVVEGHVPAADIKALANGEFRAFGDRTLGIAVPGMPHGVAGMETGRQDDYEIVAFASGGRAETVKRYEF